MAEPLYRLLAWLSPAYPIGAFSYSHGIETAVEEGFIKDRASLVTWLQSVLLQGTGAVDGALFAAAWRAAECRGLAGLRRHRRARGGMARHVGDGAGIAPAGRLVPVDDAQRPGRIPRSMRRTSAWRASSSLPVAVALAAAAHGIALAPARRRLPARLHRQPDLGRGAHRAARPK